MSLLELTHNQAAKARRRRPVHRTTVVARLVVAQGVEGHVGARQLLAGHALDVHLHARRIKGETHRRRVHVHEDRVIPRTHAAQQAQAVHAHGARRAHIDDTAALRHDRERLVPAAVSADRGHEELATASSDRHLHEGRTRAAPGLVDHADSAHRHLAGDNAVVLHAQGHGQRGPGRNRGDRDHEGHQAHDGHDEALQPAEGEGRDGSREHRRDHRPPHRGQRAQPAGDALVAGQCLHAGAQGAPRILHKST